MPKNQKCSTDLADKTRGYHVRHVCHGEEHVRRNLQADKNGFSSLMRHVRIESLWEKVGASLSLSVFVSEMAIALDTSEGRLYI